MKISLLLLTFLYSQTILAQDDFKKKLKEIIADSSNKFQKFKGYKKEMTYSLDERVEYFFSTDTLLGTRNNFLTLHPAFGEYGAEIADSVKKKEGDKIIEVWRSKMSNVLGGGYRSFEVSSKDILDYKRSGWEFVKGRIVVSILLYQIDDKSRYYFVSLEVFYEPPR